MNKKEKTLWMPIDEVAAKVGIGRATLYRWIQGKRISSRKIDGFCFVDAHECNRVAREPRRSRGRTLAVQKARKERSREYHNQKALARKDDWGRPALKAVEKISVAIERKPLREWPECDKVTLEARLAPLARFYAQVKSVRAG